MFCFVLFCGSSFELFWKLQLLQNSIANLVEYFFHEKSCFRGRAVLGSVVKNAYFCALCCLFLWVSTSFMLCVKSSGIPSFCCLLFYGDSTICWILLKNDSQEKDQCLEGKYDSSVHWWRWFYIHQPYRYCSEVWNRLPPPSRCLIVSKNIQPAWSWNHELSFWSYWTCDVK